MAVSPKEFRDRHGDPDRWTGTEHETYQNLCLPGPRKPAPATPVKPGQQGQQGQQGPR